MQQSLDIREIQGCSLNSPYAGERVITRGLVTGVLRRGFYIQTPKVAWNGEASDAVFVFGRGAGLEVGKYVEVEGECIDFLKHDFARPMTQIRLDELHILESIAPDIQAIELNAELLPSTTAELAKLLNSLEGMLVSIPASTTFIAPSNPFGDYVCALPHHYTEPGVVRSRDGGLVVLNEESSSRWYPGFRLREYRYAKQLNVGAKLLKPVMGPLHYRVDSWQVAVNHPIDIEDNLITENTSGLQGEAGALTVLTLNGFNLDWHVESPDKVSNPRFDVDDDWGEGRFHSIAKAIVEQAKLPDIIALQEIQDNDGAEITEVVDAAKTYTALCFMIQRLSGIMYKWIDIPPKNGEDGGQPGGNIRNAYLYNPERVELLEDSVVLIGESDKCYEDSRKPLMATFKEKSSGKNLTLINVHLVSKREQQSIFSPENPGVDLREDVRIQQAKLIYEATEKMRHNDEVYYVTGDFNDHEHSKTLDTLKGDSNINLVNTLPPENRYDYNHRGKLHVLMHGIVNKTLVENNKAEYEILHGNELIGVEPGVESDKPSDHAYVIAKLYLT